MYRTYGRQTRRPAFRTATQQAYESAQLDARLARQDRERQERLDAAIDRDLATRTSERIAQDNDELARLDAKIADEYRKNQEWTERRRREQESSLSLGT
jgi:hypothetical protein